MDILEYTSLLVERAQVIFNSDLPPRQKREELQVLFIEVVDLSHIPENDNDA